MVNQFPVKESIRVQIPSNAKTQPLHIVNGQILEATANPELRHSQGE